MALRTKFVAMALAMTSMAYANFSCAHGSEQHQVPPSMRVTGDATQSSAGLVELKFRDFFKMPIGPQGLEISEKLLGLNGKRVRIVGYMANAESPVPGMFVLSPLPVELGDEDESLSDDIPPSALFVHLDADTFVVPHMPGLVRVSGTLSVGNQEEADGHVSMVRLRLDPEITADIVRTSRANGAVAKF